MTYGYDFIVAESSYKVCKKGSGNANVAKRACPCMFVTGVTSSGVGRTAPVMNIDPMARMASMSTSDENERYNG